MSKAVNLPLRSDTLARANTIITTLLAIVVELDYMQAVLGDCAVDWPSLLSFASFLSVASCSILSLMIDRHKVVFYIVPSLLAFYVGRKMNGFEQEVRA